MSGSPSASIDPPILHIALAGNPNSGKTTLFNSLTGAKQKTANYAGVTLEKKEGYYTGPDGRRVEVLDLPGLYSLSVNSPEEKIAQEVLMGSREDTHRPDLAVVVVDASNLERNLYLAMQVAETGVPVVIALNMMDVARQRGLQIDSRNLSRELGVPVVEVVAKTGEGVTEIKDLISRFPGGNSAARRWRMDGDSESVIDNVARVLRAHGLADEHNADWLARRSLFPDGYPGVPLPENLRTEVAQFRAQLPDSDDDLLDAEVVNRYHWIRRVYGDVVRKPSTERRTRSEFIDRIVLHRVFGPVIFAVLMGLMFQAIFSWAELPMTLIEDGVAALGSLIAGSMPPGELRDLLLDGVIGGVGNVLVFLPQIVLLFFFIALLEDTGYMARAAFLMDRIMGRVGLNGHAFIPLLSSFACAIPGIMATRTIKDNRDRLVTIMVAPLMTCSARLPVYMLLIAAFFPADHLFGFISLRGLIMLGLYLGGIAAALMAAWVMKRFILKGERSPLLLEMPSYKLPNARNIGLTIWDSSASFVKRAGTIILVITIMLWFLITHPADPAREQELTAQGLSPQQVQVEMIRNSYMGTFGRLIEPAIAPLGYDWKIGVGLISSFAAREVIISTLGTIYSSSAGEEDTATLSSAMVSDINPETGTAVWTPLVAASVLVFFIFACMCMSTLITIYNETKSLRWPAFVFGYTLILAYGAAFIVYQGGRALGFV